MKTVTSSIIVCFFLFSIVQAEQEHYELSQHTKDCIAQTGNNETIVKTLPVGNEMIPEDDQLIEKFFECRFAAHLGDDNKLIDAEKYIPYVVNHYTKRTGGRRNLAKLMAEDAVKNCKDLVGDSKGKTIIKISNCLKRKFKKYQEVEA